MNETLNLEEYRCRKCRRVFYIDATERSTLDLDFGCPYGCDDNGERERDIMAETRETADGRVNDFRNRPVMPEMDDFRARALQNPAHNVYGRVMTVEQRRGGNNPDMMSGLICFYFIHSVPTPSGPRL